MTPQERSQFLNNAAQLSQNRKLAAQNKKSQALLDVAERQERAAQNEQTRQNELFKLKTFCDNARANMGRFDDPEGVGRYLQLRSEFISILNPDNYSGLDWKQCAIDTKAAFTEIENALRNHYPGVFDRIAHQQQLDTERELIEEIERWREHAGEPVPFPG
ncbi:MAG TPA: hypothetical protein EYG19_01965, partial [Verrucomicrobia bacterium]|nr:hypothetical protein [Verrucomicrobiota bacterium]